MVCLTDGRASHPGSRAWPPVRIARARRAELGAAVGALAPGAEIAWIGHPDGALPSGGTGAEECAARLAALMPEGALVVAAWARDPHGDHERGAALVARAAAGRPDLAVLSYPVWGRFAPAVAVPHMIALEAGAAAREAKARALACHATQTTGLIADDPAGFRLSAAQQAHFLDHPEMLLAA